MGTLWRAPRTGTGMAAGCRPEPPWTYRRIAGEYAYLEKRFVAELAPPWPPVPSNPPCRLQDFTTRPRVPPTPCPPRQPEGTGGSGPWGGHPVPAPRPPLSGDKLGPPTYEVHMQRVQAAHARRGGPPPYISPPAYDGPPPHPAAPPPAGTPQPPAGTSGPGGSAERLEPHAAPGGHRGQAPVAPWDAAVPRGAWHPPALPDAPTGGSRPGAGSGAREGAAGDGGTRPH
ncbi:dendrin isoform X2 [Corvus hawaiiensis]|uniref:dendrin isoform X2 n=1 Tax=Corvus hawaiiensis TaxID=134902 RepID=UPI00201858D4|nr:dendrin isoform X2 [Corvus hawaiiensis]